MPRQKQTKSTYNPKRRRRIMQRTAMTVVVLMTGSLIGASIVRKVTAPTHVKPVAHKEAPQKAHQYHQFGI